MSSSYQRSIVLTALAICGTFACRGKPPRKGVILISIDTLRADHLGLYGYDRPTSPYLDSLANRAVVFSNEFIQVPGTLPSHMSIFTGLYPEEHDVWPPHGKLSPRIKTLPEVFRRAGFRTAAFTGGGYVSGVFGFARGFEVFDDSPREMVTDADATFAKGIGFLDQIEADDRFFLFLHTYSVHDPYFPPLPYTAMFLDKARQRAAASIERERFPADALSRWHRVSRSILGKQKLVQRATLEAVRAVLPKGAFLPTGPNLSAVNIGNLPRPSPRAIATYKALYDASIRYMDDVLRAFFEALDERGLRDSTLIVITADHGEEFMEHGHLVHEQVYAPCVHTPLLFVIPGSRRGARVRDVVESIDIAPTIYDLMGIDQGSGMSGKSLVPLLSGSSGRTGEAYVKGAVSDSRSLVRFYGDELLQLVAPRPIRARPPTRRWFGKQAPLVAPARRFGLRVRSFHEARMLDLLHHGHVLSRYQLEPKWSTIRIELPEGLGRGTRLLLRSDGCLVPKKIGANSDTRCIAFAIRKETPLDPQLFNLSKDPLGSHDVAKARQDTKMRLLGALASYRLEPAERSGSLTLKPSVKDRLRALGYLR